MFEACECRGVKRDYLGAILILSGMAVTAASLRWKRASRRWEPEPDGD